MNLTHAGYSDGAFAKDGTFIPLPEKLNTAPFMKLFGKNIFDLLLLLAEGKITTEVVEQIQSWRFSGSSVDHSVRLETGDTQGIERLAQHASMLRHLDYALTAGQLALAPCSG